MGCFSVFSMYYPIPTTTIMIWFSLLVVMQAQEEKMFGALMMGNGPGRGFGCLACRHPCCFFTNCTKPECPSCHLKVPMCQTNCPCNIFTSDTPVQVPWELNETADRGRGDYIEEAEVEENFCGASECDLVCAEGEFCANTGAQCMAYPCCDSVSCIQFNV